MTSSPELRRAFNPLWWFTVSVTAAAAIGASSPRSPSALVIALMMGFGSAGVVAATRVTDRRRTLLLVLAGLSLGGWRGIDRAVDRQLLDRLVREEPPPAVRIRMTILDGWVNSRWGHTVAIRVHEALRNETPIPLPRRCRLEVRTPSPRTLPRPGETIDALATVRGDPNRILLVVASDRLLTASEGPSGLPHLRDVFARSLLKSAGTDAARIRAAELAGALALGRKDLLPAHRRDGWRESGLGHALAVSGLHVGVVAGLGWLAAVGCGLSPVVSRLFLLVLIPVYVLLAGSSPSATRAGVMIAVFLLARLIGRAVLALGAVFLTATIMVLVSPGLVFQPGFQLTVAVTAALIRWTPVLARTLRGPGWATAALAVPIVAQLAAAPIVAIHFRTITPLAAIVNLGVPVLLTPSIPCAIGAVAVSNLWAPAASPFLDIFGVLTGLLWHLGALGRSWLEVAPSCPPSVPPLLAILGLIALRLDWLGKIGAWLWISLLVAIPTGMFADRAIPNRAELLNVGDGLSALVATEEATVLFDSGRYRSEAAELLADAGIRHLDVAFVSHGDEDHSGGFVRILKSTTVDVLMLPPWLLRDEKVVSILREGRRSGTRIIPAAAGLCWRARRLRLEIVWPPAEAPFRSKGNDRSLVTRVVWPAGAVLLTGDIGSRVEKAITGRAHVACDVLVVPHHGSRSSSSAAFLSAAAPRVALVPAGPKNRHHHPHANAIRRITTQHITIRTPKIDGKAGARYEDGSWRAWP